MAPFSRYSYGGPTGNRGFVTNGLSANASLGEQQSVLLDGISSSVQMGVVSTIFGGSISEYSIQIWMKPAIPPAQWDGFITSNSAGSWTDGLMAFDQGSDWRHATNHWSNNVSTVPDPGTLGWHHLVMTYKSGETGGIKFYLNGTLGSVTDTLTGNLTGTSNQLTLGRMFPVATYHTNAYFCQVAGWNKALTAANVTTLYGAGSIVEADNVEPSSLKVWHRYDANDDLETAAGIIDHSDNGNHGTGVNTDNDDLTSETP